jgi:hypothetical protein
MTVEATLEKILLSMETMQKRLDRFESMLKPSDSQDIRASIRRDESFSGGGAATSGRRLSSVMFASPSAETEVMDAGRNETWNATLDVAAWVCVRHCLGLERWLLDCASIQQ